MCPRQILLNPPCSPDKIDGIVIMFFHTGGHSQHIRVKDDMVRIKIHFLCQQSIGSFTYLYLAFVRIGLTFFIKSHHHYRCTQFTKLPGMCQKLLLPLFQRDGIHYRFSLQALQSGTDYLPLGRVYHHRNTGYFRFRSNQIQEMNHLGLRVKQAIVHIDIQYQRTILHLLTGYRKRFIVFLLINQTQKLARTCHITTLSDIHKINFRLYFQQL